MGSGGHEGGLLAGCRMWLAANKVWWLTPILLVFLVFAVLLAIGATGNAPVLYGGIF